MVFVLVVALFVVAIFAIAVGLAFLFVGLTERDSGLAIVGLVAIVVSVVAGFGSYHIIQTDGAKWHRIIYSDMVKTYPQIHSDDVDTDHGRSDNYVNMPCGNQLAVVKGDDGHYYIVVPFRNGSIEGTKTLDSAGYDHYVKVCNELVAG